MLRLPMLAVRPRFRLRAGPRQHALPLGDAVAVALIAAVALVQAAPLLSARDLATGAGDWHAHLFRVEDLSRHGLASWTHDWAGGLPLWSAYQFVPHLIVWLGALITGAEPARAMAAAQGVLVLWLPLSMYLVLRWSGVRPSAALTGALLVLALDSRRQALANFSELWGLALAPLLLWSAYRTSGRRAGNPVAMAAGLSVYVHPLAAVTGAIAIVAAALVRFPGARGAGVVRWAPALALQGALVLGAAGFFLLPALWSARPAYAHPYFSSVAFERLLARLAVGSFFPGWPLWLGAALACALALAARASGEHARAARYLLLVGGLIGAPALGSLAGWGPRPFLDAQLPRMLGLLPLLAAAIIALTVDAAPVTHAAPARFGGVATGVLLATLAVLALVRGEATGLADATPAPPPFTRWLLDQPEGAMPRAGGRIEAPPEVVADASALAYGRAWYTGSYSGQEWSILAGPLAMYMEGVGTPETRAAYLTAMAVDLAVVPPGARPPITDPRTGAPAEWEAVAGLDGADVLRLPWHAAYAFTAPAAAVVALAVPDRRFLDVAESYVRDELTRRYAALALGPDAVPARLRRVRAPSGTSLDLAFSGESAGRVLLISENWDSAWQAEAGGRRLAVRRAGPNLLAVDVEGAPRDEEGAVRVRLVHRAARTWTPGALAALLAVGVAVAALRWGPCLQHRWGEQAPATEVP